MQNPWYVYIIECADKTFYTGITTDLERRLAEQSSRDKGARYTRSRRPVDLMHSEKFASRSQAAKRELKIKRMRRKSKIKLFEK